MSEPLAGERSFISAVARKARRISTGSIRRCEIPADAELENAGFKIVPESWTAKGIGSHCTRRPMPSWLIKRGSSTRKGEAYVRHRQGQSRRRIESHTRGGA